MSELKHISTGVQTFLYGGFINKPKLKLYASEFELFLKFKNNSNFSFDYNDDIENSLNYYIYFIERDYYNYF
jgi:hypothetical protein